jgi:hypothetical protein
MVDDGSADSILQFRLERECDETKCCRKMKRMQQARLDFMGRKHDIHDGMTMSNGGESAPEREKGEDDVVGLMQILLDRKIKKNIRGRFSCYKRIMKI